MFCKSQIRLYEHNIYIGVAGWGIRVDSEDGGAC